jgi:hypothetical protein
MARAIVELKTRFLINLNAFSVKMVSRQNGVESLDEAVEQLVKKFEGESRQQVQAVSDMLAKNSNIENIAEATRRANAASSSSSSSSSSEIMA